MRYVGPMRVCIPCNIPGGPEVAVTTAFEEADYLDYYELRPDGNFEHEAETKNCSAGCVDPVDAIIRRGTEAVVVAGIRPDSLMRLWNAGVKVYHADDPSVRVLLDRLASRSLNEIKIDSFAELGKGKS